MTSQRFKKLSRKKFEHERILSKHRGPGQHSVILVLDHLKPGFNVAKIFRTANAFGVSEVYLVGIPTFDVRAAMGGFKHTKHTAFETFATAHAALRAADYTIFALAVGGHQHTLHATAFPERTAFVVGHEEFGLSFAPADFAEVHPLTIAQFGEVQSLNVSIAASIAVYEYLRQHALAD